MTPEPNVMALFDRRIDTIERGLDDITTQMHDQARTLSKISDALTAVVRLEERLTASIESSKDQKASLERVHNRLDGQAKEVDSQLALVYTRIEAERKECAARFAPVNDAIQQSSGALRFASFIFPILATLALSGLGAVIAGQQSEIRELNKTAAKHESYDAQLRAIQGQLEAKK